MDPPTPRPADPSDATFVIDAAHRPWGLNLPEVWRYRDLLVLLARRDLVTIYKQTVLGPLWFVLQPLLTSLLFVVIFTRVARLSTDGVPPLLFYLAGTVFWNFFAESLRTTSDSFVLNADLFQKVYFPRVVLPVAKVMAGGAKYLVQLGLFGGFWLYYYWSAPAALAFGWRMLAVVPLSLVAATLGLGAGLLLSSLTYKYRDLQHLVLFGIQLAMYATPVIYPLSSAPERLTTVLLLNPMAPLVEAFRLVTLGTGTVTAWSLAYSAAVGVAVLLLGVLAFNRAERTFADTV